MLKIKFNINEFTIIFLRRFDGKNERKRISFSLYQLQRPFSVPVLFLFQFQRFSVVSAAPPFFNFSFSVSFMLQRPFLFFSFLPWSAAPFSSSLFFLGQRAVSPFFFPALTFLFLLMCCPFSTQVLSPKCFSVQPNTFFFSFLFSAHLFYFNSAPPFVAFVQLAFHLSLAPHVFFSIDMLLF